MIDLQSMTKGNNVKAGRENGEKIKMLFIYKGIHGNTSGWIFA